MANYKKKIDIVVRLQHWMDSVPGQTFLNYAYSWGAAIVILGTLFKLTHLPGANLMLFIGMGTEVVVFFLSAFDRPFDKTAIGKELPETYETDEEIAARMGLTDSDDEEEYEKEGKTADVPVNGNAGTVIIGNLGPATVTGDAHPLTSTPASRADETGNPSIQAGQSVVIGSSLQMPALPEGMEEASQNYVETLRALTETLSKVEEQSRRLTQDSEEMINLNRTLTGINTVYELQLKGISSQIGTIDQINEQTRRMAAQIEELNGVYSRMIKALTVNMKNAASGQTPTD